MKKYGPVKSLIKPCKSKCVNEKYLQFSLITVRCPCLCYSLGGGLLFEYVSFNSNLLNCSYV